MDWAPSHSTGREAHESEETYETGFNQKNLKVQCIPVNEVLTLRNLLKEANSIDPTETSFLSWGAWQEETPFEGTCETRPAEPAETSKEKTEVSR